MFFSGDSSKGSLVTTSECDSAKMSSKSWECESPGSVIANNFGSAFLATLLVLCFVLPDVYAAAMSMRGQEYVKISLWIIFEGLLGIIAGFTAGSGGDTFSLIVNAVGIIFIHEIDDKIYAVTNHLTKTKRIIFFIILFIVGFLPLIIGVLALFGSAGAQSSEGDDNS